MEVNKRVLVKDTAPYPGLVGKSGIVTHINGSKVTVLFTGDGSSTQTILIEHLELVKPSRSKKVSK